MQHASAGANRFLKQQQDQQDQTNSNNTTNITIVHQQIQQIVFIINKTNVLQPMNKQTNKMCTIVAIPFPPLLNEILWKLKMFFTRPNGNDMMRSPYVVSCSLE
jgi:hypothetical protein